MIPALLGSNDPSDAAVVFTDLVDSTQAYESAGSAAASRFWAEHDKAGRELLRAWRGREVGRSDGFLILFPSAADALGFGLGYHRMLAALQGRLAARVGVHWGPVQLRENSEADRAAGATPFEVDGLAVPAAARVMSLAQAGQMLFTAAAVQALGPVQDASCEARSLGFWRLKGLSDPMELFEVGATGLAPIPPADNPKAYRVLQRDGQWVPLSELPHNLGAEPDLFVGRKEPLHALAAAFEAGARLVTILGIGGIGKTRLAQRFARGRLGDWPGGAWFCDLAAARSIDGIALAVAQALGVPLGRADPVQQLARVLAARNECLIVLDNFEQVARCADSTLGAWLRASPQSRFLVTSREVLGLAGEQVQVLAPMPADEAQTLFTGRMRSRGLQDGLAPSDLAALPDLVALLDGLPLAIELAAARASVVPPADQVHRMSERFRLLTRRGDRHDRQATLRTTLDWSWDLLSDFERSALAQLSVFEGGFTLDAAEAVIRLAPGSDAVWSADLLQSLLEKSLLRRLHARRFDMLRTVQDYALERLAAQEAGHDLARRRHWRHFAGLSEPQATVERCIEIDNLSVACRRAASEPDEESGAEAVQALLNTWAALRLVGPFRAALALAAPLLERPALSALHQAQVQRVLGAASGLLGETEAASSHYLLGEDLARRACQPALAAQMTCLLADLQVQRGQLDAAEGMLRAVLADAGADDTARLMAWNGLGHLAATRSDWAQAAGHFSAALDMARVLGDRRRQGGLEGNLGTVAMSVGDWDRARKHLEQGLAIADDLGDRQWAGNARCNLGLLLFTLQEYEPARAHLNAALQGARDIGQRRLEAVVLCNLGLVAQALGQPELAQTSFEEAVAIAQALPSPQLEGQFRGYLGALLGSLHDGPAAQRCFDRAVSLLEDTQDQAGLALLECQRAVFAAELQDGAAATSALLRARSLTATLALAPGSELARALAQAEQALSSRS